jgi:pSer/pThr/pTyr-binding forkhead associated (FHA) protein
MICFNQARDENIRRNLINCTLKIGKSKNMATIKLLFKDKILENYQIGAEDSLLIGRDNANDVIIDNLAVSAQHAKIESIENRFLFVDLESENGSFVNERHIRSHWLNHGDIITIGKHVLEFLNPTNQKQQKIKTSMITKTMQLDTQKIRELMKLNKSKYPKKNAKRTNVAKQEKTVAVLSYLSGNKKRVQLNDSLIKIGKDPKSDVLIKGFGIGKTAAVINKLSDGWYISCVGRFSKPRLNNMILKKSIKLNNLDIITIGSTKLQFLIL